MAAEEGQVLGCHTVEAWNEQLQKGNESKKLIVVDFTASWCGPCRFIAPFLAELAKKLPNVTFLKVDVDELKSVAEDWAVEATPTFMFLKEGKIVDKVVGAKKDELQQTIAKHLATECIWIIEGLKDEDEDPSGKSVEKKKKKITKKIITTGVRMGLAALATSLAGIILDSEDEDEDD